VITFPPAFNILARADAVTCNAQTWKKKSAIEDDSSGSWSSWFI